MRQLGGCFSCQGTTQVQQRGGSIQLLREFWRGSNFLGSNWGCKGCKLKMSYIHIRSLTRWQCTDNALHVLYIYIYIDFPATERSLILGGLGHPNFQSKHVEVPNCQRLDPFENLQKGNLGYVISIYIYIIWYNMNNYIVWRTLNTFWYVWGYTWCSDFSLIRK